MVIDMDPAERAFGLHSLIPGRSGLSVEYRVFGARLREWVRLPWVSLIAGLCVVALAIVGAFAVGVGLREAALLEAERRLEQLSGELARQVPRVLQAERVVEMAGKLPIEAIEHVLASAVEAPTFSAALMDHGALVVRAPPEEGDGPRISFSRPIEPNGLSLVVSMTRAEALSSWRRQAIAIGVVTGAACAGVALLMWTLARLTRERAHLLARNRSLEENGARARRQALALAEAAEEMRAREKLLSEGSEKLSMTLRHIDQGILMIDANDVVVVYNQRVLDLLGLPRELLEGRPKFDEVLAYFWAHREYERDSQEVVEFVRAGAKVTGPHRYERTRPNGQVIDVRTLPLPSGGMVRTFTDITERKQAEAKIERAALFDELTGLPNRFSVRAYLDEHLRAAAESMAVLYINLDRFRLLNDARGHVVGDALLQSVAARLAESIPDADRLGRTGGDEFAIAHAITPAQDDSSELAATLLRRLSEPYVIDGKRITITASIGVATASSGMTAGILLRNADIAMYRAKDAGRNQLCRYEPAMATEQQERFHIEQSLREALGTSALRLAYQPIVSLESNAVVGFEALLRWNDPVRGEISPATFIPLAESTGLINTLGRSALEWACDEAARWSMPRTVAVNLSPAQFHGDDLVRQIEAVLARSGLHPSRLELEITEGMVLEDTGPVRETMLALRHLGVSLTLDDFGTGHAGLSYLRRFPFQKFKIDRSFVRNLGRAREADTIVEEMLSLAKRLDMRVVAEGVELESQLECLRRLGCTYVQGYLTGRPVFAEVARTL